MDKNFYKVLYEVELDRLEDELKRINKRNNMPDKKIKYTTPICPYCKSASIVYVTPKELADWQNGIHIQDAFIDMVADERELLKTGIHPECWVLLFNDFD